MSFDRLLRESLHQAAVAGSGTEVEDSLSRVHLRRRRRVRTRRALVGLAAAALVAAVTVGAPAALEELRGPADAPVAAPPATLGLAGVYVVDVADSPLAGQHGMTGRWEIELEANGGVRLEPPDTFRATTSGIAYRTEGREMRVDAFATDPLCFTAQASAPVGSYQWSRTAEALQFTPVTETCAARELLFAGQPWEVAP